VERPTAVSAESRVFQHYISSKSCLNLNVAVNVAYRWYLIAGENDVLDLGDVDFGHASKNRRQRVETIERQNEHK